MVKGPRSVGAGTVVPGVVGGSGGRGFSWRGDSVEVGESMGPGPAHGPQRLSREGLAPGRTSEDMEGALGSAGKVLGVGVAVALGTVGGKGVSTSLAGGIRGRSGLCWLATIGPASHEALCVHSCCHTHQLQPQRLLTQARHGADGKNSVTAMQS